MNETALAKIVAEILADRDFTFLPLQSYIEAVNVALYEYTSYYPKRTSEEIDVDTSVSFDYDLSSLPNWKRDFSVVIGIEIVQTDTTYSTVFRGTYVKQNYFEVEENPFDNTYKLKLLFRFKGKIKVYYTLPYEQLAEVPQIDLNGIKYLACYYACLSSSAKASQLVENYIGADKTTFDRRAQNFMKLADMYKKQAYTLLNIPEEGIYPYSQSYAIPYIERRRAIRRTT